jgi:hypothetical protein
MKSIYIKAKRALISTFNGTATPAEINATLLIISIPLIILFLIILHLKFGHIPKY